MASINTFPLETYECGKENCDTVCLGLAYFSEKQPCEPLDHKLCLHHWRELTKDTRTGENKSHNCPKNITIKYQTVHAK